MEPSFAKIVVRADRLEWGPAWPVVRAGFEPLKIAVLWGEGSGAWASLRLGPFTRVDGSEVETLEPAPEFEGRQGDDVAEVRFRLLEREDVLCRAALRCTPPGGGRPLLDSLEFWLAGAARRPAVGSGAPDRPRQSA